MRCLAEAIHAAFARWDLSHLHPFELEDGRLIGFPDPDPFVGGPQWLDHAQLEVCQEVGPGDRFGYVFDLGDNWHHRCEVPVEKVDPEEALGIVPDRPFPLWGWGGIPDQYGRESANGLDFE